MIFTELPLFGAYLVEMQRLGDERGFFARAYCAAEFAAHGLEPELRQCSVSYNARKGTLRGMHYQGAPHEEHKLVRCTAGAIYDVIVDIRTFSPTYRRWYGAELTADNRHSVFIPPGFAHGFMSLTDHSEVYYMISAPHAPESARGVRWNDPAVAIEWPVTPVVISARDAAYPLLDVPSGT
ncbi:MAG TPA: dTDP-4-dehydrorhamnose 3,5-epimerase [Steroidobacteraceae bacterium]|jgi:dTDP-4-dehydrorhamnose 3,5-epimerase|nr:dTDP-4-dehydrorhamnose 3,5-epimerase [Steroidobacteraceae bacterium]